MSKRLLQMASFSLIALASCGAPSESAPGQTSSYRMPPVLMYHEVTASPSAPSDVSTTAFREQMNWLASYDFRTLSLDELSSYISRGVAVPRKSIVLTFDDGYEGNYTNARPILKEYGLKAAFFVHTNFVGKPGGSGSHDHMTWDELRALDADPLFEVGSHTKSHPKLTTLSEQAMRDEIGGARVVLESELGGKRPYIAYPFGDYDATVINKCRGFDLKLAFAVGNHGFYGLPAQYSIPRIGVGKNVSLTTFKANLGYR